jgi:Ribonuclease G/E
MLTYIERGHQFTLDFGDIDEPFYMALENMWENLTDELRRSPAKYELYEQFESRLMKMRRKSDIGWGYGDTVRETVDELKASLGETRS